MSVWHSKYNSDIALTQQELRDISQDVTDRYAPHEDQHLPELVLLAVDPNNLYAYWNLNQNQQLVDIGQAGKLSLRVYSSHNSNVIQDNLGLRFDIPVDSCQGQQKIPLPIPGISYFADIGVVSSQNDFELIASSNTVHIPTEFPAEQYDAITGQINEQQQVGQDSINNAVNSDSQSIIQAFQEICKQNCMQHFKNFNDLGYDLWVCNTANEQFLNEKIGTFVQKSDQIYHEPEFTRIFSGLGRLESE